MSEVVVGAILVGLAVAAALAGLLIVRRVISPERLRVNHDVVGAMLQVLATSYAVLLAFAVVIVWQGVNSAKGYVDTEANQLYDLYRLADSFPDAQRVPRQQQLKEYARVVIEEEWPLLADGRSSPRASEIMSDLWWNYTGSREGLDTSGAPYLESLRHMSTVNEARRQRLLAAAPSVPTEVWFFLLFGAALTIACTWFFGSSHLRSQVLLTAALVFMIAAGIFVVRSLDSPFDGSATVNPDAFVKVLDRMQEDQARFHSR